MNVAELLERAARLPSPSGAEAEVAAFLVSEMGRFCDEAHVDASGNAVGVVGSGPLRVYVLGHIDTVPGEVPVRAEDGKLYGIPVDCNPKVFWFNKGLLEEAGFTPDPVAAFTGGTWNRDALDDMLTKVKATGKRGMVVEGNWFDLFSLITTFADFDIVRILTAGGPQDMTHVFATYAFQVGIQSGDIPLGASVSLFMFPILAFAAFFVLRGVTQRTKEIAT